jgi:hypothetical protein
MKEILPVLPLSLVASILLCQSIASAQTSATVSYTTQQTTPGSYQYSFTLTNTGTGPIGTFWFGWYAPFYPGYPAYDLLPSSASSVSSPTGWTGQSVQDGYGGYAIEWDDTGTPLVAGNSLSGFTITTPDTPAMIAGPSILGSFYPVSTSWVYAGASQRGANPSDQGSSLNAVAVPEPGASFIVIGTASLLRRRKGYCNHCR